MNAELPWASRQQLSVSLARQAGRLTLRYFQTADLPVERKADDSPVTVADREAEQFLRRAILDQFPDDAILGEEFGARAGSSGFRWILDPIDGTKSFISGVPLYGTLVGIEYRGQAVAGVIDVPGLDECVYAGRGQGAWYIQGDAQPRPAHVSNRRELADSLFLTSQIGGFRRRGAADALTELEQATRITRTWGDCYGYLLVAVGRAEIMIDPEMNIWDAAAVQPVIEEAGGVFTDWQGRPTYEGGDAVAANPHVAPAVLAITGRFPMRP